MSRVALVMAGGTGGHIFPGLAVAEELRSRGWQVHWLGAPGSMEQQLVPPRGFAFEPVQFGGVRGKGPLTLLLFGRRSTQSAEGRRRNAFSLKWCPGRLVRRHRLGTIS